MTGKMGKKNIPFGVSLLLIVGALVAVQTIWWKGLVAKPPGKSLPRLSPGPAGQADRQTIIPGREEVIVETFAGDRAPGVVNGEGYAARFDRPTGLAMDKDGNLLVCDTGNNAIRRIAPSGETSVLAGGEAGNGDGTNAKFNAPCGIAVAEDGSIYVADTGNRSIRRISNGSVSSIAPHDKLISMIPLSVAIAKVVNASSKTSTNLLIADSASNQLLKLEPDGRVSGIINSQSPASSVAISPSVKSNDKPVIGIAFPKSGDIMIGEKRFHEIPVESRSGAGGGGPIPRLKHPLALCPFGQDWLISDSDHGALFLFRNGKAEVLAGYCSSGGPLRGARDGTGANASFNTICGIAFDGKKYVYLSDTDNNLIRRLDVSRVMGR